MRFFEPSDATVQARSWLRASGRLPSHPWQDLYQGISWSYLRKAESQVSGLGLAAVSAGFGLLTKADLVPSYDATFASGPDQVARRILSEGTVASRHRAWWAAINKAQGKSSKPLSALLRRDQPTMIALGEDYLLAIEEDLMVAADSLTPESLLIITGFSGPLPSALDSCRLVVPPSARTVLSAPNHALSARVALWIAEELAPRHGWDFREFRRKFQTLSHFFEPGDSSGRQRMDDAEVKRWISAHLSSGGGQSASASLRAFRGSGLACEQSRFRRLFEDALRDLGGGKT
jgi:hypothetical protein